MAIIKCKMCGGDLIFIEGQNIAECDSCGTRQTVPNGDDEKKLLQFERAERLRKNCEFDKAAALYETIVAEHRQEAEAYWGLVLCRYGIEYVDDPSTGKKVPICHRSSFDSILEDQDFEQALENADLTARRIYRQEAKQIEEIRKGIVAVSSNEAPYDIFICYKETDENGERTLDSVLAQDLYDALTAKGYRVFFARITLEDKLGQLYEPFIFAALNSAKVMLAVGTDYEYYNAVWVKNEWSRFLKLMAKDSNKFLIPCFKGIDPYDMPREFARLQAQDLGKMGAIQDLLRNMEKYIPLAKPVVQERVVVGGSVDNKIASLLDRGSMALEDGDWAKADSFFEDVLNNDSKNAQAYLGKTLAQEKCRTMDAFIRKRKEIFARVRPEQRSLMPDNAHVAQRVEACAVPGFVESDEISKLYRFNLNYTTTAPAYRQQYQEEQAFWANHKLLARAEKFAAGVVAENLQREKKALFAALGKGLEEAEEAENNAREELRSRYAAHLAQADAQAEELHQQGLQQKEAKRQQELQQREARYQQLLETARAESDVQKLTAAAGELDGLGDYKDSKKLAEHCRARAAEEQAKLDAQAEAKRIAYERAAAARKKKNTIIGSIAAVVAVAAVIAGVFISKNIKAKQIEEAYISAIALADAGKYEEAIAAFSELDGYKDSATKIEEAQTAQRDAEIEVQYQEAVLQYEEGKYKEAKPMFEALDGYKDSQDYIQKCEYGIVYLQGKSEEASDIRVAYETYQSLPSDFLDVSDKIANLELLLDLYGTYSRQYENTNHNEKITIVNIFRENDSLQVTYIHHFKSSASITKPLEKTEQEDIYSITDYVSESYARKTVLFVSAEQIESIAFHEGGEISTIYAKEETPAVSSPENTGVWTGDYLIRNGAATDKAFIHCAVKMNTGEVIWVGMVPYVAESKTWFSFVMANIDYAAVETAVLKATIDGEIIEQELEVSVNNNELMMPNNGDCLYDDLHRTLALALEDVSCVLIVDGIEYSFTIPCETYADSCNAMLEEYGYENYNVRQNVG